MTYDVFSVRDKKVEAFLPPFFARNMGEAIRMFSDACHDVNGQFYKHAEDFVLFRIGHWDDSSGLLLQDDKVHPEHVVDAMVCLASREL